MASKELAIVIYPKILRLGAQEKDTSAGLQSYSSVFKSTVFLEFDSNDKSLTSESNIQFQPIGFLAWSAQLFRLVACYATVYDPAMRATLSLRNAIYLRRVSAALRPSIVVTETSSLLPFSLLIPGVRRFSRSVNYEPVHFITEHGSSLRNKLVFALKVTGVFLERFVSTIISISVSDADRYRRCHVGKKVFVLPLRGLLPIDTDISSPQTRPTSPLRLGLFTSTFNVPHNRRNIEFVCQKVLPRVKVDVHLTIFGSKVPESFHSDQVTVSGWVEDLESCYRSAEVFLASYQGGTGVQSKVFEPMARGKVVICDPRLVEGTDLLPGVHYIPATTFTEFAGAIDLLSRNPSKLREVGEVAMDWSRQNLSEQAIHARLAGIFSSSLDVE